MKSLISVIVPIYNSEKYIKKCVGSILSQTYTEIEVILIDDGSSDRSASICDEYKEADERVIVLHNKKEGLIATRKDGFRLSHGQWIAFVDSDDWIDERMLESLHSIAEKDSSEVVISGVIDESDAGSNLRRNPIRSGCYTGEELNKIKQRLFGGDEYFSFIILPYLWNKLWRRDLLKENLMSADEAIRVGEDVSIGFPTIMQTKCLSVTDDAFYHYRQNPTSMLKQRKNQEAEHRNAISIYNWLNNRSAEIGYIDVAGRGIRRLYINLIMTRAYDIVCKKMPDYALFPFVRESESDIIIYGAGALGLSVYNYAKEHLKVKAWVDRNAEFLKTLGYPVFATDDIEFGPDDVVVVSIFEMKAAESVKKFLISRGVAEDKIMLFSISEECEKELLEL